METSPDKCSVTDFKFAVNFSAWLSNVLAIPVNNLIHFECGERYAGIPGMIAVPLILFYSTFMSQYDARPLYAFLGLYIVMALVWQFWAKYQRKRGQPIHSRSAGHPYLHRILPSRPLAEVQRAEPLLVFTVGFLVAKFNPPLGIYLIAASVGMAVSDAISRMIQTARLLDQIDAMIEQRAQAEEVRQSLGQ